MKSVPTFDVGILCGGWACLNPRPRLSHSNKRSSNIHALTKSKGKTEKWTDELPLSMRW